MRAMSGWRRWVVAMFVAVGLAAVMLLGRADAQVATTNVQGTVYRADGSTASGTLLVSWPTFSTALDQSIAAGSVSTTIGANGFVSLNLAPNAGASPAGTYYTAVYHLSDGTVSREYWVVPQATTASISSVRAQLAPATIAVQQVSKSYVDASIAAITGNYVPLAGGTMNGPLQLSSDPVTSNQAATKHYADALAAEELPLTGGSLSGALTMPNAITKLPKVDVRDQDFGTASGCPNAADPTGQQDSTCAIQAAITWAENNKQGGSYPPVYFAPGNYKVSGNITDNGSLEYYADGATLSIASGYTVSLNGYRYSGTSALSNEIATSLQPSTIGQISTNPAQVKPLGSGNYSGSWQFHLFNGHHTWSQSSGWYGDDFQPQSYTMEDDQPGLDWGGAGTGGHSQFYPYYYSAISRSPAFLEYGMGYQQNSISDSGQYDTGYCEGGVVDADDEGCFHINYNGGELRTAYTGTVTSVGTNSVMTSCTGGCPTENTATNTYSGGAQGDLRYLINTSSPFASGYIESTTNPSGTIPGTVTVSATVPVSTAWGSLQASCGPGTPASPIGVTTTAVSCSVNLDGISSFGNSPGSFTTTGIVCFSGLFHECAYPTSVGTASGGVQTVNFNLLYPHNSGSIIMQGGAADTYIDLLVNRGTTDAPGATTLKYPIDVIGSTSANTLVDVEFFRANGGSTVSIGDGTLRGNLLLGQQGHALNLSNSGGVVTMYAAYGNQSYSAMNGQNIYFYSSDNAAFDGACTNFSWNGVEQSATCKQSSSTGQTASGALMAINCTSSNAACVANQYGNGDFVLYEGAQVLDVQDPNSTPANAIDGYFQLEPNPWTWTGATVEEPHHYAQEIMDTKGLVEAGNPYGSNGGISVALQGTGFENPYGQPNGAVGGFYNASGAFGASEENPLSYYAYYGGSALPPDGMDLYGQFYKMLASNFAPNWGGSAIWVGCPESSGSVGGCGDTGYSYNLFFLAGNSGPGYNSAAFTPANDTLTWNGPQYFNAASSHSIFGFNDGANHVAVMPGGQSGWGNGLLAFPLEQDSGSTTATNDGNVVEYTDCQSGQGCGIKDTGIAAANVLQNGAAIAPTSVAVNGGHVFTRHTIISASENAASVAANTCATQTLSVGGLIAGDHVINRDVLPSFTAGLTLNGVSVSSANVATMYFCNSTAAAITPPSGTYTFDVEQ